MGPFVPVHLASLKRAVGDLDQGTAWLRVFVMVNVPLTNGGRPRIFREGVQVRRSATYSSRPLTIRELTPANASGTQGNGVATSFSAKFLARPAVAVELAFSTRV
jgi:hypothetical protein